RQSDQHLIMRTSERLRSEQSVAQSLRPLLHHIEDLRRVVTLRVILHNVALLCRDHHAYLVGTRGNHPLHQVLRHSFRTLNAFDGPRTYGQQFFRTAQRLDPLSRSGSRNDPDHEAAPIKSSYVDTVPTLASSR